MFGVLFSTIHTNAYSLYVDSILSTDVLSMNDNLIVTNSGNLIADSVNVGNSLSVLNHGVINTDFYIADSLRVYVQNSGVINAGWHVGTGARLIQIIESGDDITDIGMNSDFDVLVQNATGVSVADVLGVAANASRITIDNSSIILNGQNISQINTPEIEIVGDVVLKLNYTDFFNSSAPVLHNVSNTGAIRFDTTNMNPLYKVLGIVRDGDLYMNLGRETDYVRILQNDTGIFLNNLRRVSPDDKLLRALDNAPDMATINSVMDKSVRLKPINLMAPIRRMDMFDILAGWRYADLSGIHSAADIMYSDTEFGGQANVALVGRAFDNLRMAISGNVGAFNVSDDINDYDGQSYGINISAHYDDGQFIGNLLGGINYANFEVGAVFDGTTTVNNPNGVSGFGSLDIGRYVWKSDDLSVAPFVGAMTHYVSVLNDTDIKAMANFGAGINWSDNGFDILYDYGLRGSVLTDGAFYTNAYVKFMAPFDDIGAELNIAFIYDDNGMNYRTTVSAYMSF